MAARRRVGSPALSTRTSNRTGEGVMKQRNDDAELRAIVLRELDWNSLLDASQLDAAVEGGVVTLVGTVRSLAEKLAAQSAIESLDRVHDVVSRIDVKRAERPTDTELRDVIADVLTWDALVPEHTVGLDVCDGKVTLAGHVSSASQRVEAERAVSRVVGVRGVDNRIAVDPTTRELGEVREAIDDALRRRAEHRSRKIDVIVDDGAIILRGTVESLDQKRAVREAVAHAPGVLAVCDELAIG